MPRAHCVFLIQPTYGNRARKKPWAGGVYGGGRQLPRSGITDCTPCPCEASNERRRGVLLWFPTCLQLLLILFASSLQCYFWISCYLLESQNWELYFSRHRAKEAGSRRQFRIYEICSYRIKTSFLNIFLKNLLYLNIWILLQNCIRILKLEK